MGGRKTERPQLVDSNSGPSFYEAAKDQMMSSVVIGYQPDTVQMLLAWKWSHVDAQLATALPRAWSSMLDEREFFDCWSFSVLL